MGAAPGHGGDRGKPARQSSSSELKRTKMPGHYQDTFALRFGCFVMADALKPDQIVESTSEVPREAEKLDEDTRQVNPHGLAQETSFALLLLRKSISQILKENRLAIARSQVIEPAQPSRHTLNHIFRHALNALSNQTKGRLCYSVDCLGLEANHCKILVNPSRNSDIAGTHSTILSPSDAI
jgi:hypothetical protein